MQLTSGPKEKLLCIKKMYELPNPNSLTKEQDCVAVFILKFVLVKGGINT